MSEPIGFLDRLGDELDRARPPAPRSRPEVPKAVVGLAIIALTGAAFAATRPTTAATEVAVLRIGDQLELRILESPRPPDAEEVEDVAHDAGIHLHLRTVATGPSRVGWLVPDDPALALPDGAGIRMRFGDGSEVVARYGVPADGDEPYHLPVDPFAADELLACVELPPGTAGAVGRLRDVDGVRAVERVGRGRFAGVVGIGAGRLRAVFADQPMAYTPVPQRPWCRPR